MIRVETARDLLDGMRPKPELVAFAAALDGEAAKTAFLAQDVAGIGHSMKVRERIGGADRAIAVREDALEQRRLDS